MSKNFNFEKQKCLRTGDDMVVHVMTVALLCATAQRRKLTVIYMSGKLQFEPIVGK